MEKNWLLAYSNLMTIFLVFFLILYVFSLFIDEEKFENVITSLQIEMGGKPDVKRLQRIKMRKEEERLAQLLNTFIKEHKGLRKFAQIKIEKREIKVIFAEPLVFDSGSAELKPGAIIFLEKLAEILRKIPNEVIIEGHTDNVPPSKNSRYSSNWELSLARAFSVVHYFTKIEGLSKKRFIPVGYAEYKPVAPNDSEENRRKNRRIEIKIRRIE